MALGKSLDQLVALLGERNHFQIILLLLVGCNYIPVVFNHVIMAFYGSTPRHHCRLGPPVSDNVSYSISTADYENVTVLKEEPVDKCEVQLFFESGVNTTVVCQEGQWIYEPSFGEKTIVSEWNLVCQYKYLNSLATTIYFSGVMIGGPLFGHLSDNIGRLPVLLITLYLPIALGVGIAFVPSYSLFVLLRFVQGVLMQGLQTSSYVLVMEFFNPRQRPTVGAVMECFWGATVMVLPGLAYLLPNWRYLQLAISLPSILTVIYIWFLPESLRWVLLKGKTKQARKLVTRMCDFNKIPFPEDAWECVQKEAEPVAGTPQQQYNITHLLRTGRLRQRSLVLYYLWLTIATGYFGLTFQITSLPGNKYINFFIGGLVEFIAYALSLFVMNRFGRKKPLFMCFLSAAACCIIAAAIPRRVTETGVNLEHVSTGFAIAGRFSIAGLFSVIFVYTTELYPTVIRNIGIGTCTFWARLGGMIAPQINQLGSGSSVSVPILIFGCMMLAAAGLILLIPETHNRKLPDTIADVENGEPGIEQVLKPAAHDEHEMMMKKPSDSEDGII